ncbi:MAG: hypothetical protein KIT17_28080 [Rubrivivax sp.]|nr:hypothetical protein [Rubrivivax sp.]
MSTLSVIPTAPRGLARPRASLHLAMHTFRALPAVAWHAVRALVARPRWHPLRERDVARSLGALDDRTLRDLGLDGLADTRRGRAAEVPAEFHRGWM